MGVKLYKLELKGIALATATMQEVMDMLKYGVKRVIVNDDAVVGFDSKQQPIAALTTTTNSLEGLPRTMTTMFLSAMRYN